MSFRQLIYDDWWLLSLTNNVSPQALAKRSKHFNATHRKIVGPNICLVQDFVLVWLPCCDVLRHVACCWFKFNHFQQCCPTLLGYFTFNLFSRDVTLQLTSIQAVKLSWTTVLFWSRLSAALSFIMTLDKLIVYMYIYVRSTVFLFLRVVTFHP